MRKFLELEFFFSIFLATLNKKAVSCQAANLSGAFQNTLWDVSENVGSVEMVHRVLLGSEVGPRYFLTQKPLSSSRSSTRINRRASYSRFRENGSRNATLRGSTHSTTISPSPPLHLPLLYFFFHQTNPNHSL